MTNATTTNTLQAEEITMEFPNEELPAVENVGGFWIYGSYGPFDSRDEATLARWEHQNQISEDNQADDCPANGAGKLPNFAGIEMGISHGAPGVGGLAMIRQEPATMGAQQRNMIRAFKAAGIGAGEIWSAKNLLAHMFGPVVGTKVNHAGKTVLVYEDPGFVPRSGGQLVCQPGSFASAWLSTAGQAGWLSSDFDGRMRGEWMVLPALFGE